MICCPVLRGVFVEPATCFGLVDSKVLRTPSPSGMAIGVETSSRIFVWRGEWRIVNQLIEAFCVIKGITWYGKFSFRF